MNKHVYWMPLAMAAFVVVDAGAGPVSATDSRYMAPPGLYEVRIQSDRTTRSPDGRSIREEIEVGAEGDHKVRYSNSEGRTGSYGLAGDKPHRSCIPAAKPGAIPAQMLAGGCVGKPGVVKGERMVSEASCPWGKMTFSARRVDAKTWENTIDQERKGSVAGAATMRAGMPDLPEAAAGAGSPRITKTVIRMTRIADSCK